MEYAGIFVAVMLIIGVIINKLAGLKIFFWNDDDDDDSGYYYGA